MLATKLLEYVRCPNDQSQSGDQLTWWSVVLEPDMTRVTAASLVESPHSRLVLVHTPVLGQSRRRTNIGSST